MTRKAKERRLIENGIKKKRNEKVQLKAKEQWNELIYNLKNNTAFEILVWKSIHVNVLPNSVFEVPIQIEKEEMYLLNYQFHTKFYDIHFGIYMNNDKVVLENTKFESQLDLVTGTHRIQGPCVVYLCWNNEYSWWNRKIVSYNIQLQPISSIVSEDLNLQHVLKIRQAMEDRKIAIVRGRTTEGNLTNVIDTMNCNLSQIQHDLEKLQMKEQQLSDKMEKVQKQKYDMQDQILIWTWEVNGNL